MKLETTINLSAEDRARLDRLAASASAAPFNINWRLALAAFLLGLAVHAAIVRATQHDAIP